MISSKQSPKTFKTGPHLWGIAFVASASLHMLTANLANSESPKFTPETEPECYCTGPFFPIAPAPERQAIYIDTHILDNPPNANYFGMVAHVRYLVRPSEADMIKVLNGLSVTKPTTVDLICTPLPNGRLKDCVALTSAANPLAAPTVALYERHVRLAPLPAGSSTLPKVKLHYSWPANI